MGQPRLGLLKSIFNLVALSSALVILCSCTKAKSGDVSLSSFGLSITKVSGDNQIVSAGTLFPIPLVVQVTDNSGAGVKDISVTFSETTSTGLIILTPTPTTNASGMAQTSLRSPVNYNQTSQLTACVNGSTNACVTFNESSDNSGSLLQYTLTTQHNGTEIAGVPFFMTVKLVDRTTGIVDTTINTTINLEWTFVTQNSWSGIAPSGLPASVQACTFVAGVCNITSAMTLVDARRTTNVFVGNGPTGYLPVFNQTINVVANVPSHTIVTDILGGPAANASTIANTIYSADSAPVTFHGAITDLVGNYISDITTATWTSTNPIEITGNLSTTAGPSTTLTFHQSIPFPTFGTLSANVPGFTAFPTGQLSIDPGPAANVVVVPPSNNFAQVAGQAFSFQLNVLDDKGNICGQTFGSTGFTGTFPVTITFSNYTAAPAPSGGTIPMLKPAAANVLPVVSRTISVPFFAGQASLISQQITFWDVKVNPVVGLHVDSHTGAGLPAAVNGSSTFSVTMNMDPTTWHLMLRDAAGATANSLCPVYYPDPNPVDWFTFPNILDNNYTDGLKSNCTGITLTTDGSPVSMNSSIEDQAGNFIADLPVTWNTQASLVTQSDSLFQGSGINPMLSVVTGTTTGVVTLTPYSTTDLPKTRWLELQATYGGVNYDQFFLGQVNPGSLASFKLAVMYTAGGTVPTILDLTLGQAEDDLANTLAIIPLDHNGNPLTTPQTKNIDVTVTGIPQTGPDSTPPSFITSGTYSMPFLNQFPANTNILPTWAAGKFANLITPHAGDVMNVTVFLSSDHSITGSINYTVVPGYPATMQIWEGGYPAGTNITGQNKTYTCDQSLSLSAVAFDSHLNAVLGDGNNTNWSTTFANTDARNMISLGTQTPFNPWHAASGTVTVTRSTPNEAILSAASGTITLAPGAPNGVLITADGLTVNGSNQYNVTAGQSIGVTAKIVDSKQNIETGITGPINLSITTNSNATTRLGFDQTQPASGNFNFSNGLYDFVGAQSFKFYNALHQPAINITANLSGGPVVGQSTTFVVAPSAFDHLADLTASPTMNAGSSDVFTTIAEDLYGNQNFTGAAASQQVTFQITSILGNETISASTLTSPSISNFALPNQKTITGNLVNGSGTNTVWSSKSGLLTVHSIPSISAPGTNTENSLTVLPLTTVASINWAPGQAPVSPSSTTSPLTPFVVQALDSFNNVITSDSTDLITLSLTGATSSLGNYLPVTLTNGQALFSNLTYTKAESFTLEAIYQPNATKNVSVPMVVNAGLTWGTAVVLPNQTWTEGTGTLAGAITGPAFSTGQVTAGTPFTVIVHAVDSSYNTETSYNGTVSLTSTDPHMIFSPTSTNFINGVATFTATPQKEGTLQTITASTPTSNNQASSSFTIKYSTATQLIALFPTQTLSEGAPSFATAINGSGPLQTAGTSFNVTVLAVDAYFNQVQNYSASGATLTINGDPNAPVLGSQSISSGSATFAVVNYKASNGHTLTPVLSGLTSNTSTTYQVQANSATQYVAVFQGQTLNSGQAPNNYAGAVTNPPSTQTAGTGFSVNLYAVDNYFNQNTTYAHAVTIQTPSDPNAAAPSGNNGGNFVSGLETFTINPVLAINSETITVTTSGLTANTPANYKVQAGASKFLVAIFSSYQSLNQGTNTLAAAVTPTSISTRTAGTGFSVQVVATDAQYNQVSDSTTTVSLSVSTPNSNVTPSSKVLTGGSATFTLTGYLAGLNYTVTPSGGTYSSAASTAFNIGAGATKFLLVQMPGQSFVPGQSTAAAAIQGPAKSQTQGASYPYTVTVIATDGNGNQLNTTDSITLSSSVASTITTNPKSLVSGTVTFSLFHTANGNAATISAANGLYTTVTGSAYNVIATMNTPTLALSDATTGNATYARSTSVATSIGNATTAVRWCLSETQTTAPTTGTNGRSTCSGGGGTDLNWYTSAPTSITTTGTAGAKTIYLWVADAADNVNLATATSSITLDTFLPGNPTGTTLTSTTPGGNTYTSPAAVSLSTTLPGASSILTGTPSKWCTKEVSFGTGAPAVLYNDACWQTTPGFPTTYTFSTAGQRTVYVYSMDAANNISATPGSATMWYVPAASNPTFAASAINGVYGGTDLTPSAFLGTTLQPSVSWQAATDLVGVNYVVTITDTTGTVPQCSGPSPSVATTTYTFTGCNLVNGTSYRIYLAATDAAGNTAAPSNNGFSFQVYNSVPTAFNITGMGSDTTNSTWLKFPDVIVNPIVNFTASSSSISFTYTVAIQNSSHTNLGGACTLTGVLSSATSATLTGCTLSDSTQYYVTVTAVDSGNNQTLATAGGNPYYGFTTSFTVDHFTFSAVGSQTSGVYFPVTVTAIRKDGSTATNYSGAKTITWSATPSATGTDLCGSGALQTNEFASSTLNFPANQGFATTASSFAIKKINASSTLTATDAGGKTGTSAAFAITAATTFCTSIETAAAGAGSVLGTQTINLDDAAAVSAFAIGRDAYGNWTSDQAGVTWSGTGVLANAPVPTSGSTTKVVGTWHGTGTLVATGGAGLAPTPVNFTVNDVTAMVTWTTATTDASSNHPLSSNNVSAVFDWKASSDNTNAWRTAGTQSWYSEASSANRGTRAAFPAEAILVASSGGLDIIDENTELLWMHFNIAANDILDNTYGSITDVTAIDGKIYVAMNTGTTGTLVIIDMANDAAYRINSTIQQKTSSTIANRNTAGTWNSNATYPMTSSSVIGKLYSAFIGGKDYVVIGTTTSAELLNVTAATVFHNATAGAVTGVALTSSGSLYYAVNGTGIIRSDLTLPISANFSASYAYTTITTAKVPNTTFSDLAVATGTSTASGGSNTIIVAGSPCLTVIQENPGTPTSASSATYGKVGTAACTNGLWTAGTSENVLNLDIVQSASAIDVHMVTTSGWYEIRNAQLAPTLNASSATSASDVKAYHATSPTANDAVIGLTSGGITLNRR